MGVLQIFSFLLLIARATVAFPLEGADSTVVPVLRPPDAGGDAKYPIESAAPEDVAPAPSDSAPTDFPILTPSDEDFEVLRPVPAEEEPPTDASNVQADNNSDAAIERPYPALEKLGMERLELGTERFRRSASGNDGDDEPVVIESAGNETGDDDTVTVNAASCGELLSSCKDENDLLSCQAYNENCTNNEGDDAEIGDFIDCSTRIATGRKDSVKCPPVPSSK